LVAAVGAAGFRVQSLGDPVSGMAFVALELVTGYSLPASRFGFSLRFRLDIDHPGQADSFCLRGQSIQ